MKMNAVWCCVSTIALCVHYKGWALSRMGPFCDGPKRNSTGSISNAIFTHLTEERKISHAGTLKLDELHVTQAISHQNDGKVNKLDSRGKCILVYIVIKRLFANSVEWLNHWIDTNLLDRFWNFESLISIVIQSNPIQSNTLAMKWVSGICNLWLLLSSIDCCSQQLQFNEWFCLMKSILLK